MQLKLVFQTISAGAYSKPSETSKMKHLVRKVNDTHKEKLCFTLFSTKMAAWLLLIFFVCLHNQLSSIHFITRIKSTDV